MQYLNKSFSVYPCVQKNTNCCTKCYKQSSIFYLIAGERLCPSCHLWEIYEKNKEKHSSNTRSDKKVRKDS